MKNTIKINLLDFVKTGEFGGLKPGMTRKEVLQKFPLPLDYTTVTTKDIMKSEVWFYGGFEFHFEGDKLWLIFCDHLDMIYNENSIEYDPWIFTKKKSFSLKKILNILVSEEIAFFLSYEQFRSVKIKIEHSGVEWGFSNDDYEKFKSIDWKKWKLANLSVQDKTLLKR